MTQYPTARALFLFLAALFWLAACRPTATTVEMKGTKAPEPTSIILVEPTLTSSPTPQPINPATPEPSPTFDPGGNDLPEYYGGLVITMDDVQKTYIMRPGTGFLLSLGENFSWEVSVSPPDLLTANLRFTPEPGQQGVYIARQKGRVTLSAIGDPRCLGDTPPCARPSVLFTMNVVIE